METEQFLPPPEWENPSLVAKPSTIARAGLGVFATQPIRKGKRLADYIGEEMTHRAFIEKYAGVQQYYYSLRRVNKVIDGHNHKTQNVSHYINESAIPNVMMKRRGLYALKDIAAGEELFLSYPREYTRCY